MGAAEVNAAIIVGSHISHRNLQLANVASGLPLADLVLSETVEVVNVSGLLSERVRPLFLRRRAREIILLMEMLEIGLSCRVTTLEACERFGQSAFRGIGWQLRRQSRVRPLALSFLNRLDRSGEDCAGAEGEGFFYSFFAVDTALRHDLISNPFAFYVAAGYSPDDFIRSLKAFSQAAVKNMAPDIIKVGRNRYLPFPDILEGFEALLMHSEAFMLSTKSEKELKLTEYVAQRMNTLLSTMHSMLPYAVHDCVELLTLQEGNDTDKKADVRRERAERLRKIDRFLQYVWYLSTSST